jgi:hypothetical protein
MTISFRQSETILMENAYDFVWAGLGVISGLFNRKTKEPDE